MTTNSNANQISTTHECWKAIHISLVGRPDCALGSSYSPDYFGLQKTIKTLRVCVEYRIPTQKSNKKPITHLPAFTN